MKDLKSILKGLRTFKEKDSDETIEKTSWIKLKDGFSYKLKFIPFYDKKADDLKNILNYWTHYINDERYICDGKFNGCKCCEDGHKATAVNLVNIQLIQTTDDKYKNRIGEHFVLNLNYTILNQIQDYEKKNNESIFDIFEAATVTVNVTSEIVGEANNSYSKGIYETKFSTTKTSIKPNIENDTEEELWLFLKTIPKDLNDFILGKKYVRNIEVDTKDESTAKVVSPEPIQQEGLEEEDDFISGVEIEDVFSENNMEEEEESINSLLKEFNLDLEN